MDPQVRTDKAEIAAFCRRWNVIELAFFGSVVRDDFSADSDIDVLVAFAPDARPGFLTLSRMERELAEMLGRRVEVTTKGGLKPLIRESVLAQAEILYAA